MEGVAFPIGSSVDEVDEMHADLVYWDAMTAEAVVPMVERSSPYAPGALDFSGGLTDLRERLVALRAIATGSESDALSEYVEYVDALSAVIQWATDQEQ